MCITPEPSAPGTLVPISERSKLRSFPGGHIRCRLPLGSRAKMSGAPLQVVEPSYLPCRDGNNISRTAQGQMEHFARSALSSHLILATPYHLTREVSFSFFVRQSDVTASANKTRRSRMRVREVRLTDYDQSHPHSFR